MEIEFKLPSLGNGVNIVEVVELKKAPGDHVQVDDPLLEVMTDKADIEIPSPFSGTLLQFHANPGEVASVGDTLATIISGITERQHEMLGSVDNIRIGIKNLRLLPTREICGALGFNEASRMPHYLDRFKLFGHQFSRQPIERMSDAAATRLKVALFDLWRNVSPLQELAREVKRKEPTSNTSVVSDFLKAESDIYGQLVKCFDEAVEASRPRVFVGSSSESLPVARMVQEILSPEVVCTVWKEDRSFELGSTNIDALEEAVTKYDYGVFILSGDDRIIERNKSQLAPRDNVIFELGLFTGRLGKNGALILRESNSKVLSDLKGVIYAKYSRARMEHDIPIACEKIRRRISQSWPWFRSQLHELA